MIGSIQLSGILIGSMQISNVVIGLIQILDVVIGLGVDNCYIYFQKVLVNFNKEC